MSLLNDFRRQKALVTGLTAAAGLTFADHDAVLAQTGVTYIGPATTVMTPMHDEWTAANGKGPHVNECGCPEYPLPSPNENYRPLQHRTDYLEKVAHVERRPFKQNWHLVNVTTGGYAEKGADGKMHCRDEVSNYNYAINPVTNGYRGYTGELKVTLNGFPGALRKDDTLLATALRSRIHFSRGEMGKPLDAQNTPDKVSSVMEMRADYRVGQHALDPQYAHDATMLVGVRTYDIGADRKPHLVMDSGRDLKDMGNSEVRSRKDTENYLGEMIDWAGKGQGLNFSRGPEVLANGPTYREYIAQLYLADVMHLTPKDQQRSDIHRTKTPPVKVAP